MSANFGIQESANADTIAVLLHHDNQQAADRSPGATTTVNR